MKQATLDRIRITNKRFTNKLIIRLAGKRIGHLAILGHAGRKSGRLYHIPIIAEPTDNGFVIALTYGKEVDWYKNVMAHGGGTLLWKNKEYTLSQPHFVEREVGLAAFPALMRPILRRTGTEYFLYLEGQETAVPSPAEKAPHSESY